MQRRNGVIFTMIPLLFDPLFCRLIRCNGLLLNSDGSKYSMRKIE